MTLRPFIVPCIAMVIAGSALAGSVEEDWQAIIALDAGPGTTSRTADEARSAVASHLNAQERALRTFLAAHPKDAHAFEANLRLARLLDIRGGYEGSEKSKAEALKLLESLAKTATPEQRVEVDFARVTRLMRGAKQGPPAKREELLAAARRFQSEHSSDRRAAALLAEVATLFDSNPKLKLSILSDASALAIDPQTKGRIADDIRRLDLMGQEIPLSFTSVQGKAVKIEDYRGKPVVVIFFADFSPPSAEALMRMQQVLAGLPKASAAIVGVSLDAQKESVDATIKAAGITWPVAFDGKSWKGEIVRGFGINTLPTVWLLDKKGALRSLNALEGTADLIRQLQRE